MATKVLVVDDEEDYRIIIGDVLRSEGCEVACAADGEAGLAAALAAPPDVVLVDWMMPKLDGRGLVRALRRSPLKGVPILMLTVKQSAEDELEAIHFGVDDFLVKPFQAQELAARVKALLRRERD